MATFGENLKRICKEKNLLLSEVAKELNISNSYLSQYIKGSRNPKIETLASFSKILDCNVLDLVKDTDLYQPIKNMIDISVLEKELSPQEIEEFEQDLLFDNIEALNNLGKHKVLDYVIDLRGNPTYNKRTNPNNIPKYAIDNNLNDSE